jgi:hypothetical protein
MRGRLSVLERVMEDYLKSEITQLEAHPEISNIDYGSALRFARLQQRCLPAVGVHFTPSGAGVCQCGAHRRRVDKDDAR